MMCEGHEGGNAQTQLSQLLLVYLLICLSLLEDAYAFIYPFASYTPDLFPTRVLHVTKPPGL